MKPRRHWSLQARLKKQPSFRALRRHASKWLSGDAMRWAILDAMGSHHAGSHPHRQGMTAGTLARLR
jgi:hypothetical protein